MDALGGGRLEVVGGCLGAGGSVIVWPHGTKVVNEDPLTIGIPDNGTFTLGEEVRVGGGYVLEHSPGSRAADPFEVAGRPFPLPAPNTMCSSPAQRSCPTADEVARRRCGPPCELNHFILLEPRFQGVGADAGIRPGQAGGARATRCS